MAVSGDSISAGGEDPTRGIADTLQVTANVIIVDVQAAIVVELRVSANRAPLSPAAYRVSAALEIPADRTIHRRERGARTSFYHHIPADECRSCSPQNSEVALNRLKVAKNRRRRRTKVVSKKISALADMDVDIRSRRSLRTAASHTNARHTGRTSPVASPIPSPLSAAAFRKCRPCDRLDLPVQRTPLSASVGHRIAERQLVEILVRPAEMGPTAKCSSPAT